MVFSWNVTVGSAGSFQQDHQPQAGVYCRARCRVVTELGMTQRAPKTGRRMYVCQRLQKVWHNGAGKRMCPCGCLYMSRCRERIWHFSVTLSVSMGGQVPASARDAAHAALAASALAAAVPGVRTVLWPPQGPKLWVAVQGQQQAEARSCPHQCL